MKGIAGASDVFALRNEGMKYLKVEIDRFAAGRLGINVRDVQQALRVWVDGRDMGIVLEQERRIPLMLRGEGSLRRSADRPAARHPRAARRPHRGAVPGGADLRRRKGRSR